MITKGTGGPGSASRIELRGAKSIGGNSAPIYVIDGVPIGQGAGGAFAGEAPPQETSERASQAAA